MAFALITLPATISHKAASPDSEYIGQEKENIDKIGAPFPPFQDQDVVNRSVMWEKNYNGREKENEKTNYLDGLQI